MIHRLICFKFFSILESTLYFKVHVQKKLFYPFDHIFQCGYVICKSFFTIFCHRISGIRFSTDKSLMHFDITILLQAHQVGSQVSIGYLQHLLQVIEADLIIDHQDAHHSQPDAVIKDFI